MNPGPQSRPRRRGGSAFTRALLLLVLASAVFVSSTVGTVTVAQQATRNAGAAALCPDGKGGEPAYVPQEPSEKAVADIPPEMMKAYREAGKKYGLDWTILAGVGAKETDHGRNTADGGGNETGPAQGPMQFTPGTFSSQGVDGNGDGKKDVKNPDDAAHSAANYLKNEGAPDDYRQALITYNGDPAYADEVIKCADEYKAAAEEDSPSSGKKGAAAFLLPGAFVESLLSATRPAFAQENDEASQRGPKKANGLFSKKPPKGKRAAKNPRSALEEEKAARDDARDDARDEERAARHDSKKEARAARDAERARQNEEAQKQRLADLPKEQADKIHEEQRHPPEDRRPADAAKDSSPEEDAGPQRQVPGPCEKQPTGGRAHDASREPDPTPPDAAEPEQGKPPKGDPASDTSPPGESPPGETTSAEDAFGGSSQKKPPRGGGTEPSGDAEALANDPNFDGSPEAKQDLRDGLVDPRLVKSLQEITENHKVKVPWFKNGHSFDGSGVDGPTIDAGYGSAGGLPNTHYYGRAADIFEVDGKPVTGNSNDPAVLDVMTTLEGIPGRDRPDQMIAPTNTSSTMGASREKGYIMEPDQQELHNDHLHLGYMREDGTNNTA